MPVAFQHFPRRHIPLIKPAPSAYDEGHQKKWALAVGLSPLFAGAGMLAALALTEPDAAKGIIRTILFMEEKTPGAIKTSAALARDFR